MAILIDITIVRMLLLPSAMRLFGRWNWWHTDGKVTRRAVFSPGGGGEVVEIPRGNEKDTEPRASSARSRQPAPKR